jgi:hypothetical protein
MLSNASPAIAIENINSLPNKDPLADEANLRKKQNDYFGFILYTTFGLAAVRFSRVRRAVFYYRIELNVTCSACTTFSSEISSGSAERTKYLDVCPCARPWLHFLLFGFGTTVLQLLWDYLNIIYMLCELLITLIPVCLRYFVPGPARTCT